MNEKKYRYLLYLISTVILVTLIIQGYWIFKNYEESERQLKADLQSTLDQSIDDYFTIKARQNTISIVQNDPNLDFDQSFENAIDQIDFSNRNGNDDFTFNDVKKVEGVTITRGAPMDSTTAYGTIGIPGEVILRRPEMIREQKLYRSFELKNDTVRSGYSVENLEYKSTGYSADIQELTTKLVISISSSRIDMSKLDSLFLDRLKNKKISVDHVLTYKIKDSIATAGKVKIVGDSLFANSKLLEKNSHLKLEYAGLGGAIFKRNLTGLGLSALLIASIISCLFYLLQIIRRQKALNEMKNDLISNITHEFKTPIATASAALEGVQHFTASGDSEKTNRYLGMGRDQLLKLNKMVEKLLETATIDQGSLNMQFTDVNLNELLKDLVNRVPDQTTKSIQLKLPQTATHHMVDPFHLENAVSNLIDNALKYGGDQVIVSLNTLGKDAIITVSDSGNSLKKGQERLIFDKFYRVPQGNTHNVKGYGIGLFYTKSIIEKHKGTITLTSQPQTTFTIQLPHE